MSERRIRQIEEDFARYTAAITDQSGRIRLPSGHMVSKVPFSVFWLVEGDEFIGEASIRHELTAHLLKEGGHVVYGIRPSRRVLVTCLQDNVASARVIEANGGELENVIDDPAGRGPLRRYWISL